jgi:opacity protein-like surface antigen
MKSKLLIAVLFGCFFSFASAHADVTNAAIKAAIGAISSGGAESVEINNSDFKADVEVEDSWVIGSNLGNKIKAENVKINNSEFKSTVEVVDSTVVLSNIGNEIGD